MTSTINRSVPGTNSPLQSAAVRSNFAAAADDIEALQAEIGNGVQGPNSSTAGNIAVFADTTGKVIADGGAIPAALGWFNVRDYGAIGNGTTDDTAAINLAIAALNTATRGVLYFPAGTYKTTSALTALTATGTVQGDGMGGTDGVTSAASLITCTSGTAALFTVNSLYLAFKSIALQNTAGTPSAGAGITVTSANLDQKVDYIDMAVAGFYIDIDVQVGGQWVMQNCFLTGPVLYALKIQNTVNHDAGDWSISDSSFYAKNHNATSAIRIESSGGGKIVNCKVNEYGANQFVNGVDLVGGASTVILLISNSSFENYSGTAITASGTWPLINIRGCEFGQYGNGTGHAISISSNTDVILDDISLIADTGSPTAIVISSVTRCGIGQITNNGFTTLISGTVDQDSTGGVGSRVFVTGASASGDFLTGDSATAATWKTATAATALLNAMVGDSGSGGTKGLAPAPPAGAAAAGKFLKADGTYAVPSGSGTGTLDTVEDGSTTVSNPTILKFSGATVTESPSGTALVTISGGSGAIALISEQTPTGTNVVSFTSIGGYRSLLLTGMGRSDASANSDVVQLTFNTDTGSHYDQQRMYGNISTAFAAQGMANTFAYGGDITAATGTADVASSFTHNIYDYTGTTFQKTMIGQYNLKFDIVNSVYIFSVSNFWRSTAAITRIDVTLAAGNWVAGSRVSLYGTT